jgi:predicted amidohydrolase YtcJ
VNRRDFIGCGAALAFGDAFAQAPSKVNATKERRDDLALINAKIITLEPAQPEAQAILVRDGRIVQVGSTADVLSNAGAAKRFDAGGRTVVPGFIDAHAHFEMACNAAAYHAQCHTPPLHSLREIFDVLRAQVAKTPKGKWIVGRGSFDFLRIVEEKRYPTRQELDAITMEHPLALYAGLHVEMFNTIAFQELGLWDAATSKTPRAATVHRDDAGIPTGVATEIWPMVPGYSIEQTKAAVKVHSRDLFTSKGITSIQTLPLWSGDLRADQELQASGDLPIRLRAYYHVPKMMSLQGVIDTGLLPGVGNDMFRFGGVKIFIDGTASDGVGHPVDDLKWTQDELNEFVSQAHSASLQLWMHTLTHTGIVFGCNAVEEALRRDPRPHRHRLEHVSRLQSIDNVRRIRKLGVLLTITPAQEKAAPVAGRPWARDYKTLVDEGINPIAVTDATGTIPIFSPLFAIASVAATHQEGGSTSEGGNLKFDDALRMWTLWAARGGMEEQDKGSITVGKLGDFAVLSADPRGRPGSELFDLKVQATILGGQVVFGG